MLKLDELLKPNDTSRVYEPEISQPLCTAVQIALYNKFAKLGLEPSAVVGHSSGEIAAAYAAGHLSFEAAITVAYYRGYIFRQQSTLTRMGGAMAAVAINPDDLASYLQDGVVLACENSPNNCTISGDSQAVNEVLERIQKNQPNGFTRKLRVTMAYHSGEAGVLIDLLHFQSFN